MEKQFIELTGCPDSDLARSIMESTGGDLDMAVSSYFDMMSGNTGAAPAPAPAPARSVEAKPAPSGPRSTPASSATQRATAQISDEEYARRLAAEMHQLDDDDDVVMMTGPSGASRPGVGSGKGWGAAGDVRAADDQRVDRLIDGNSAGIPLGALGVAGQMLGTFRMPQVHRAFLEGPASAGGKGGGRKGVGAAASGKLASLLSAPSELVFPGPYEAAREFGKAHKRWLLVNIQKDEEFDSWRLNRDVWKDEVVAAMVGSAFVFWQQSIENEVLGAPAGTKVRNPHANDFLMRYSLGAVELPVVAIVDPRTNELVNTHVGFLPKDRMAERLSDFLAQHSLHSYDPIARNDTKAPERRATTAQVAAEAAGAGPGRGGAGAKPSSSSAADDVIDLSEDDQMAIAMAASLEPATAAAPAPAAAAAPAAGGRLGITAASSSPVLLDDSDDENDAADPFGASTGLTTRLAGMGTSSASASAAAGAPAPALRSKGSASSGPENDDEDYEFDYSDEEEQEEEIRRRAARDAAKRAAGTAFGSGGSGSSEQEVDASPSAEQASKRARFGDGGGSSSSVPVARAIPPTPPPQPTALPPEPAATAPPGTTTRVQLRLPDGKRAVRRFAVTEPVASIYYWASSLLGKPHSIGTVYGKGLGITPGAATSGNGLDVTAATGAAVALGAGLPSVDKDGRPVTVLALQAAQPGRPEGLVDVWDLQRPHPAASLAGEALRSIADAGLLSSSVLVHTLE